MEGRKGWRVVCRPRAMNKSVSMKGNRENILYIVWMFCKCERVCVGEYSRRGGGGGSLHRVSQVSHSDASGCDGNRNRQKSEADAANGSLKLGGMVTPGIALFPPTHLLSFSFSFLASAGIPPPHHLLSISIFPSIGGSVYMDSISSPRFKSVCSDIPV